MDQIERRMKSEYTNMTVKERPAMLEEKPSRRFMLKGVTTVIAAALLLLTSVTAAHLGSFGRLTEIIGEDAASGLIPVEIGTIDGIAVEVVAVGIDDNVIDVYVKLQDLTGANRLVGDIFVNYSVYRNVEEQFTGHWVDEPPISPTLFDNSWISGQSMEILNRCESGVVTLRGRNYFSTTGRLENIAVTIYTIFYNVTQHEVALDIDFSEIPMEPELMHISEARTITMESDGTFGISENFYPLHFRTDVRGDAWALHDDITGILVPGQFNYDYDISSIGISSSESQFGDILRVLLRQEPLLMPSYAFGLVNPHGSFIFLENDFGSTRWDLSNVSFTIGEDGSVYDWIFTDMVNGVRYHELRFPINRLRLSDYRLVRHYTTSERLDVYWTATFDVNDVTRSQLIAEGLRIPYGDGVYITEARVGTFGVLFVGEFDDVDTANDVLFSRNYSNVRVHDVRVHKEDTYIVLGIPSVHMLWDREMLEHTNSFIMIYSHRSYSDSWRSVDLDIESIVSVTFRGEVIPLVPDSN